MNLLNSGLYPDKDTKNNTYQLPYAHLSKGLSHVKILICLFLWLICTILSSYSANTSTHSENCEKGSIGAIYLVDAESNQDIGIISDGDILKLYQLPPALAIRAEKGDCGTLINSISFNLSGEQTLSRIENLAPYSIAGDNQGDYAAYIFEEGNYTLTVTPYSQFHAEGIQGEGITIDFRVEPLPPCGEVEVSARITGTLELSCEAGTTALDASSSTSSNINWFGPDGFTSSAPQIVVSKAGIYTLIVENENGCKDIAEAKVLDCFEAPEEEDLPFVCEIPAIQNVFIYNSQTNSATHLLENGNQFRLDLLPDKINLKAVPMDCQFEVKSISFALLGAVNKNGIQSEPPFFLCEDGDEGINGWQPVAGSYILKVTPYSEERGAGVNGNTLVYRFQILDGLGSGVSCEDKEEWISIVQPKKFHCNKTEMTIEAEVKEGLSVSWSGPDNFTSELITPTITQPGTYVLTATNGSCSYAKSIFVDEIPNPQVFIEDTLFMACNASSMRLRGKTEHSARRYWTGPNDFYNKEIDAEITTPGRYVLTAVSGKGCITKDTLVVAFESAPLVFIEDTLIMGCQKESINLSGRTEYAARRFWTGPKGFYSKRIDAEVSEPGVYTLTAVSDNGCETKDELLIITSASPEISLTDSLFINCQTNTVQLEGKIEYAASSFWTGPNEFYSMDLNAEVSVAGTYTLTAVSESGCETQSEVVVAEGITPMVFLGDSLFILCNAPSVRLSGKTEYSARRFWTGPKNFYSTQIDAEVREPGIYTLTAVSDKGCETKGEIVVAHGPPPMVFLEDTIYMPCNSSSVRLRGKTEYSVRRYWNGPDGFYSKQIDAEISTLGVYTLTAISAKGCEVSGEVIVAIDNREVSVSAGEDQVLSCANPLVQLAGATEGATSFEWGGPGGFESSSLSPEVGIAGSYVLTAVSSSGCSRTDTVWVQEGKKTATVNAGPDKELNCANTQVQLSGTVSEGAEISWSGPGSFVSNELEITVSQAGTYILYAMDVEGCEGWDTVEVRENIIIPEAFAGPDIRLDCQSGMGILEAYAPGDVSFNWTGPNGFIAIEPTIEVNTAGAYILTVTSDNQCTATDTVEVGPCELACEGMKITEVILLHARTGRDWMILGENDTLVTTALPDEISIEALTENCLFQVKSVGFSLTGEQEFERVDNAAPWSLVGDSEGSFLSWDYQPGTYELTITPYSERLGEGVAGIPYTLKLTILAPTPTPEGSFAMRINCGATRESSFGGYIFSEDNFYTGRTETANNPLIYDIEGTSFDQLYRLSRSSVQSEGEIVYQIPVPNATYAVHLHFAETHWDATNGEAAEDTSRIFDVYMESSKVISSLNLLNTYGTMTAYAFQYKAAVRDGILEIRLAASEDRPILSGIEILSLDLEDQALIYSPDYARERIADGSTSLELGIIPNPIRDQGILSISGQETGPLQLRVVDQGGRVWLSKQLLKEAYTQQTEIEAERLPKGLYVVVVNGKNIATSKMFIVN